MQQQRLVLLHRAHGVSLLCGGADSSSSRPTFSSPALEYARSVGFMSPILQRHFFEGIFSTMFLSFILLVLFTYSCTGPRRYLFLLCFVVSSVNEMNQMELLNPVRVHGQQA